MAEKRDFNGHYAACWAGGFGEFDEPGKEQPFVSLQIADAATGADGAPAPAPNGEIRELFFTDPEQLIDFLARGFEIATKLFPADVDRIRTGLKRRMH